MVPTDEDRFQANAPIVNGMRGPNSEVADSHLISRIGPQHGPQHLSRL